MKGITMKKILLLILVGAIALTALTACGKCKEHVDEDKDGKCDKCDEAVEIVCTEHTDADGDKMCDVCDEILLDPTPAEVTVNVSFTLKDQEGTAIPGVSVTFSPKKGGTPVTATSDASGKLTAALVTGGYSVTYTYDSEAIGYFLPDTSSITVVESTTELALRMINNTPNGTASRPYVVSAVEANAETIPAGATYYYTVYHAVGLLINIDTDALKVTYDGTEITAAGGEIDFALLGEDNNAVEVFTVENTTGADVSFNIEIYSPLGSHGNPHIITDISVPFVAEGVNKDHRIYYLYTATEAGTLTLTLATEGAYANLQNNVDVQNTSGSNSASITVAVGDQVLIDCSGTAETAIDVSFTLTFAAAGSVDTPIVDVPLD